MVSGREKNKKFKGPEKGCLLVQARMEGFCPAQMQVSTLVPWTTKAYLGEPILFFSTEHAKTLERKCEDFRDCPMRPLPSSGN